MGRDMPDSWRPVANVMPDKRAIRGFLKRDDGRREARAWIVK